MKKSHLISGALAAALVSAAPSAYAQCVGTGSGNAGIQLAPFASGGALNSLISAINTANTAFLTQTTAFIGAPPNTRPNQEGGGVWARGIGGDIDTKSQVNTTMTLGTVPGTVSCNAETNLRFVGTQVGTDMARLNWNGWNVHVGSMAGYLSATARDTTNAGGILGAPGSLRTEMEVPFVGIYAAATYGGFFIDGQVRWDFFQNRLNDPVANGLFNQGVDARGLAFTGNVGYNFQLGNNWFIEPSAGIVVSKVEVDPILASGVAVLTGNVNTSFPNTTTIRDIESTLGRLSLRGGTTIVTDKVIWQPFATASVYHDFGRSTTATYAESNQGLPGLVGFDLVSGTVETQNVGTYGQFGVGVAGQLVGTGWLGYVRGDYRTGERIEGYSINGGVRYQFTPDPPVLAPKGMIGKAPMMVASPAINWTGFYVGGSFGAINGESDITFVAAGTSTDPRFAGPIAGGQIGYNHQIGKWVLGIEGNLNWTNAHGARGCPGVFFFNCEVDDMKWFGQAVGKVGYALFDRSWYYLKGGAAFAETAVGFRCNTGGAVPVLVALAGCPGGDSQTKTQVGWTVGFGSEFALTNNWFVRGETSYFDLGTTRYEFLNTVASPTRDVELTGFVSTVGLSYRFMTGGR